MSGYITRSTPRNEDGYHSISIYPTGSVERPRAERNHIGDCNSRKRTVNPEAFETLGAEYLQPKVGTLCVMDEMGFMELDSPEFLQCVRAALDGEGHVLAAVKARYDVPYLDEVRAHPKAQLYNITEDNRDKL